MSDHLRPSSDDEYVALSDAELLARHHDGDHHAFAVVFRRYRHMLKATAVGILRDGHDADDAVQDAMLRAVRHSHTLRQPAALPGWLKTLTTRAAINLAMKTHTVERNSSPTALEVFANESRASSFDPYALADLGLALTWALDQLGSEIADTWVQAVLCDRPHADIAVEFDVALGTVASRVARAKTQIKAILHETLWESDRPAPTEFPSPPHPSHGPC